MSVRRVVTGHDASGRSVFTSDALVEPFAPSLAPGMEFFRLWSADAPANYRGPGENPAASAFFPEVGGFRFNINTVPPGAAAPGEPEDIEAALAEFEAANPGLLAHMEPDNPGMHTTNTTDFEVLLSGELILELDDGAQVRLAPGDTVVQNGTRHRWINPGSVPAVLAVFMVGAQPPGPEAGAQPD